MDAPEPPTVLVVDDDPGIRFVLQLALTDDGYRVETASDGREALDRIAVKLPAMMLLDLHMPRMTGWEVLRALRADAVPVPVVFMSAGTNAQAEAIAYGADGYLAKPFLLDTLLALVKQFTHAETLAGQERSSLSMGEAPAQPVVAIINSNDDILRLLRETVEAGGFASVTVHVQEVGRTVATLQAFLERHDVKVILYDISPPYPDNWALFVALRQAEQSRETGRSFVVTTPNKQALEDHVGPTEAIELIGDQMDKAAIIQHLQRAVMAE